jgi:antitoxin component YwqK of YwqJK toxin-antitoxin module
VKNGAWHVWDDNGNLRVEMHYTNGEKSGTWKMWNELGVLTSERKYTAGS